MIAELLSETGMLAGGFAINIAISLLAMAIGTAVGAVLGMMRFGSGTPARFADRTTRVLRNFGGLVLLLAITLLVPLKYQWNGAFFLFPAWIKAAIALSVPVIGFASDQFLRFRSQIAEREVGADLAFLAAWLQFALIILLITPVASLIGVDEILTRAGNLAAHASGIGLPVMTYVYAALWFAAAGVLLSVLAARLARRSQRARDRIVRYHNRRRRPDYQVREVEDRDTVVRELEDREAQMPSYIVK